MDLVPSRKFYWTLISFIGGVFIGSYSNFLNPLWLLYLALGLAILSLALKKSRAFFIFVLIFSFLFGALLFNLESKKLNYWRQRKESFSQSAKAKTFSGKIIGEFDRRRDNARFVFRTDKGEKILVFANRYPYRNLGTKLKIKGKLQIPGKIEGFDWQGYLAQKGIYKVIFYPEIKKESSPEGFSWRRKLFSAKQKLRSFFKENFPSQKSQIFRALILGDQSISDHLRANFSKTGTNHIVAISGLHIMIFISFGLSVALFLGLKRFWATLLALALAFAFVVLTGFKISALRAFFMALASYSGYFFGRLSRSEHTLIIAAALMLIFNPLLLRFSVGFQLSFLALLGIVYGRDFFDYLLSKIKKKFFGKDVLVMTLGAQAGVFPIIASNFGRFSLLAPLANVLILEIMPLLMGLSLILSGSMFISSFGASIIGFAVGFVLDYILGVISFLSNFSFLYFDFSYPAWGVGVYYSVLLVLLYFWRRFYRNNLTPAARLEKNKSMNG